MGGINLSGLPLDGAGVPILSANPSRSRYTDIAGYAVVNLRLGYRSDGFSASAWVRNAFDADYLEALATQSGNTGLVVGQPGDPRSYGVTVAKRF